MRDIGGYTLEHIEGYVEHIKYRNTENGYTVMEISTKEDSMIVVGTFSFISEGEYIKAKGDYTSHPLYGEQFASKEYEREKSGWSLRETRLARS